MRTNSSKTADQKTPSHSLLSSIGRFLVLFVCAVATAGLLYVSFPKASLFQFAWIAFFPFTWGILKVRRFWPSVFYGWFTGWLFYSASLYWIYYTCVHGGGLSVGLAVAAWLGLSGLLALQTAFFGGSCYYLKATKAFFPILAACGWVALEWLHQMIALYGIGFPWFMLGNTQWNFPPMLQLVSLTGVYGLSFCVIWTGLQLGWSLSQPSVKKVTGSLLLIALLLGCVFGYGQDRLSHFAKMRKRQSLLSLQVALMQPNIDQYKKWDDAYEQQIKDTLTQMGQQLTTGKTMLTVWPESVTPQPLTDPVYAQLFEKIASDSNSYQLLGSYLPGEKQYVGAYLLAPDSSEWQVYTKVKLVPFGEFVPLLPWLQKIFPDVSVLGELGSFTPGARDQELLSANGVLLGTTICYEAIFPNLWLDQARQGAKAFVNITNDAWFFNTAAPYQHLSANVVRAVETARPVLRAANTGFSAVISPLGQVEKSSMLFAQEMLESSVALPVGDYATFYTQWGDWFAWVCTVIFFTLLISTMVFAYE